MSNSKGSIKRLCEQCGGEFRTKPCMIRKGFGKYCCKPCADAALNIDPEVRFWSYVERHEDPDACWEWTAAKRRGGYGQLFVHGKAVSANRFSYELHNGPIEGGLLVMHTCDNPPCCNPRHLELGTYAENSADMVGKSRQAKGERHGSKLHPGAVNLKLALPRGEKHHAAKLVEKTALEIIGLYARGGVTMQRLADNYGVSLGVVWGLIRGKSWTHLDRQQNRPEVDVVNL